MLEYNGRKLYIYDLNSKKGSCQQTAYRSQGEF